MKKMLLFLMVACVACTISAQTQRQGYRGFAEVGYGLGQGDYDFGRFSIETTHGYQFSHYFFLGAGVGMQFSGEYAYKGTSVFKIEYRDAKVDIPIYANVHANLMKTKVSPMLDLKVGTYVNNGGGTYVNLSGGIRIAHGERRAVNISVGYSTQDLEILSYHPLSVTTHDYKPYKRNTEAITLKVGYEF